MSRRGKIIVLEGIDGSGKRTQIEMLSRAIGTRRIPHACLSFPRYDRFFGKLVAQFLNGEFGPLADVDPHFSALLYAGDRLESKPELEAALAAGKILLADRYIGSNLAHQGARVPAQKRAAFLRWLKQLEYDVYGLPREDMVIYLRVPIGEAHRLVGKKAARQYTKRKRDLQESNLVHLRQASALYDRLACQPNWICIDCADKTARRGPATASLQTPEAIHQEILEAIDARLKLGLAAQKRVTR
ncbi:MAG: thymidylate kinase [Candidatus Acidiferrales bacterium]